MATRPAAITWTIRLITLSIAIEFVYGMFALTHQLHEPIPDQIHSRYLQNRMHWVIALALLNIVSTAFEALCVRAYARGAFWGRFFVLLGAAFAVFTGFSIHSTWQSSHGMAILAAANIALAIFTALSNATREAQAWFQSQRAPAIPNRSPQIIL